MSQDCKLELYEIIWVNPILGRLANKRRLAATGRGVAGDGVSAGADEIIRPRQFNYKGVPVVLVERAALEVRSAERGLELTAGLLVMFLATRRRS
jgi:hypothetical protein